MDVTRFLNSKINPGLLLKFQHTSLKLFKTFFSNLTQTQKGCLHYATLSDANHTLLPVLQHPPGFASLGGHEGFPSPGSTGSHHTPDHKSPRPSELQGQGHGVQVRVEERQQTTRYTSATHWALPKQRLFPNSHFPYKTQLNQETPSLHSSKHMQWQPTQPHGHHENIPMVAPSVLAQGWRCPHSPQGSHWSLWWLKVWGEGERGIPCCQWPMRNFKGQLGEK